MIGLLYLPRLFVYHNETKYKSEMDNTFLLMEYRLLNYIMAPALIVTYVLGFILLYSIHILYSESISNIYVDLFKKHIKPGQLFVNFYNINSLNGYIHFINNVT